MIPRAHIVEWGRHVPWTLDEQVEQDLLLSRLIVEIANDDRLGGELVFRGGTCLHKVHLRAPLRYSEDLDYVRVTHGPIGPILDALREIAMGVGMEFRRDVSAFPKAFFRSAFEGTAARLQIKVEINTYETSPARPHVRLPHVIESPWWSGRADVLTFQPGELVATKLRALYQRRKGRDLFDLWLALTEMKLSPDEILACFGLYRPDGYTGALAIANLHEHLEHPAFRNDIVDLVRPGTGFDADVAAALVVDELFSRVDEA